MTISQTIADLRTMAGATDDYAKVLGYHTPADGGGGDFYWDAASTEEDNNGTIFQVTGFPTGRWYRICEHQVNPRWFGAKGDGITDDRAAFQSMIDFCEQKGVKDIKIPFGDYYLEESVLVRIGGIKFIGEGCLLREESWWYGNATLYEEIYGNPSFVSTYSPFKGACIVVRNGISGIVYTDTVVDSVYWRGVGFRSSLGRVREDEYGLTVAIDFQAIFGGPSWPFNVHECHFMGFNRVFNFFNTHTTLYSIAFVNITHCAFKQNDEVFYQGFKTNPSNGEHYSRFLCWGFNFQHNRAHDNSRVIYGFFGKDLVTISNNNFEGNIKYSDDTWPPYIVDVEIDNCAVDFYGNHFEAISTDAVSISSLRKNVDGSYKETDGTTALGTSHFVNIHGNDMSGIDFNYKTYTLSGCVIKIDETFPIYVHACEILENASSNIYLTSFALSYGTIIKFSNSKRLSSNFIKDLNSYQILANTLEQSHLESDDQWNRTKTTGYNYFNDHYFNGDVNYCISVYKVRSNSYHFTTTNAYRYFSKNGVEPIPAQFGVRGLLFPPHGESLVVCVYPSAGIFDDTSVNLFRSGMQLNTVGSEPFEICGSVTVYTTNSINPEILPVHESTSIIQEVGTFGAGQTWYNGTNYRMATSSGTIGTLTGINVVGESHNKVLLNDAYWMSQGQYIVISGNTYRIIELRGNWATLDTKPPASVLGASVSFSAPTIVTI